MVEDNKKVWCAEFDYQYLYKVFKGHRRSGNSPFTTQNS